MGMFDYVICNYPLPDGEDGDGIEFQTKDTDSQQLDYYNISDDGTLWFKEYGGEWKPEQYTGEINFYSSNMRGFSPKGCITDDALTPVTSWDYTATFDKGKVVKITGGKTIDETTKVIYHNEFFKD